MVTFLSKNLLIWGRAPGTTDLTLALLFIPPKKINKKKINNNNSKIIKAKIQRRGTRMDAISECTEERYSLTSVRFLDNYKRKETGVSYSTCDVP